MNCHNNKNNILAEKKFKFKDFLNDENHPLYGLKSQSVIDDKIGTNIGEVYYQLQWVYNEKGHINKRTTL